MNPFLKVAYAHGAQQAIADLEKIAIDPIAVRKGLRIFPNDVLNSIMSTMESAPQTNATMGLLGRSMFGGAVGASAGGLAAGEDDTLKGMLLGGALGAFGGGLSKYTRNRIYGPENLERLQIEKELNHLSRKPEGLNKYIDAAATRNHLKESPLKDLKYSTPSEKQKGILEDLEMYLDDFYDEIPTNKVLGSAALTGAGTIGAGILGGRMATSDSFSDQLKNSLGL